MRLLTIFCSLLCLVATSNCFAGKFCKVTQTLLYEITIYGCPEKDKPLSTLLTEATSNATLILDVCSVNPTLCSSGVYSFVNEANGLATITLQNNFEYCYMAAEDSSELIWYLTNYILAKCDDEKIN